MFNVGITGHRPQKFTNPSEAKRICEDVVIDYSNMSADITFNVGGCIGADSWVAEKCIELNMPFNLFMPFPSKIQSKFWNDKESKSLEHQILKAGVVTIVQDNYSKAAYHIRDRAIVDNSNLLVCFLEDFKSGTYSTVKYALSKNIPVFNALTKSFITK